MDSVYILLMLFLAFTGGLCLGLTAQKRRQ